jgi:hypothetical protein
VNNDNLIDETSPPDALAHDSAGNGAGANQRVVRSDVLAPFIAVAAWIVPGLGHLLQRRWGRALIFFLAVGGLAITGYLLRGNVFPPRTGEPFGTLGFLADAGAGIFYFLSRFFETAGPDVSRAAGDYGTRFIAAAGIVNLLSVFDAYEIALGRRTM